MDAGLDAGIDAGSDAGTDACVPATLDLCNGVDDDCDPSSADGSEDPSVGIPCDGPDADMCKEGTSSCVGGMVVCDDMTDDTLEVCDGMNDEDCDGMVDEDGAQGSSTFYLDMDMDSWGEDATTRMACQLPTDGRWSARGGDCDDGDPDINPGASERCNGLDDNCNGRIDEGGVCGGGGCQTHVVGSSTYLVCTHTETWANANDACTGMGYHLVAIDDAAEDTRVRGWIGTLIWGGGGYWIGLSRADAMSELQWVDGTPVTYSNWKSGEPDGSGNCVMVTGSLMGTGWADDACSRALVYVCEAP